MNFEQFSFHPQIRAGISAAGYSNPTPIQSQTIPPILEGRDVLGLAQTGTGKTAAFALPILQRLMKGPRGKLRALILSPTRELAEQTHVAIRALGRQTGLRSLTLYGGVGVQPQVQRLRAGAEIAVACPGRLLDLMNQGEVNLSGIEILVLDEADQMFDMGFLPSIRRIIAALPKQRQTLLFSATMPEEIRSLATDMLRDPVTIEISIEKPIETIKHAMYSVDSTRKLELLLAILPQTGEGQVLIFTRTKHRAKRLAEQLVKAGMSATSLQGNLSQTRRQESMDNFRSGRARVMVATDIAARGIDVSQISHVINFDLPDTAEAYTHRTGRTGRMTRLGTALTLVTPDDMVMLRTIERMMGSRLEQRKIAGFEATPASAAPAIARESLDYPNQRPYTPRRGNPRSNGPRDNAPTRGGAQRDNASRDSAPYSSGQKSYRSNENRPQQPAERTPATGHAQQASRPQNNDRTQAASRPQQTERAQQTERTQNTGRVQQNPRPQSTSHDTRGSSGYGNRTGGSNREGSRTNDRQPAPQRFAK